MSDTIFDAARPTDRSAAPDDYFRQSRRPLASLLFTLPLLLLYELGVALQGQQAILNGADVWLRQMLSWFGLASSYALPAVVVVLLLAWHHTTGEPWRVRSGVLVGMIFECAALAVLLLAAVQLQRRAFEALHLPLNEIAAQAVGEPGARSWLARLFSYFGAGVYEETLFRLMLLPLSVTLLRAMNLSKKASLVAAVVVTSLLFAAAHHIGVHGEAIEPFRFTFRFAAGAMFCVLFLYRGFGIAVGAHAFYDILAGWF
jgi:hypothetical protein